MSQKIVSQFGNFSIITKEQKSDINSEKYKTRKELENSLINTLKSIGYEYRPDINNEKELIKNMRTQLENLNSQRIKNFKFSDREWDDFLAKYVTGSSNWGIENRNKRIQGDEYQVELYRSDGKFENIRFIDKQNPENNFLQVINNYKSEEVPEKHKVTILMNGIPIVQVELKKRDIKLKEAFFQPNSHINNSFHSYHRLFEFIQIFVISNGIETKYYSNTTKQNKQEKNKLNDSFLFTSYWTDIKNSKIEELHEFAKTFLHPKTIKQIITKYCVFDSNKKLKVLRPYQIYAIEKIKEKVEISIRHKLKDQDAGGYIWHTTGSGKTLTSFKAAQLILKIPEVQKVLFVVDRKDLDHQTCKEYENYLKGSVDSTKNSSQLEEKLLDPIKGKKIIVTTIQKLSRLFGDRGSLKNKYFDEKIVIIMDECHRSQAGKMSKEIKNHFQNANIFGFTGTPIMRGPEEAYANTSVIFGQLLHSYKICDAITDSNVLPFHYEYAGNLEWEQIDEENEIARIQIKRIIVGWILNNFLDKTCNGKFNSIFATRSIKEAIEYHKLFEELQQNREKKLKVAIIYSSGADKKSENQEEEYDSEPLSINELTENDRQYLEKATEQYGKMFNSKIDLKIGLQNYHTDVSERMKLREIDILIVVNMFLTGFDAPRLNTLWVDKKMKEHNLIQALSRTNRIYDDSKPFGNITSFLNLEEDLNEAIKKFAGEEYIVITPSFDELYPQYVECWKNGLEKNFPIDGEVKNINNEEDEVNFCKVFGDFIKVENILKNFDKFKNSERLDDESFQNYQSKYLDIREKVNIQRESEEDSDETNIFDSITFEMEILDSRIIDVDYILKLLSNIQNIDDPIKLVKEKENVLRIVKSDPSWRKIYDLFKDYLDNHVETSGWFDYLKNKKNEEFKNIVAEENLVEERAYKFIENSLTSGENTINWDGEGLRKMMPPMSHRLGKEEINRRKNSVRGKVEMFFNRFKGRGI